MIRLIFGQNYNQDPKMVKFPYFNLTAGTHRTTEDIMNVLENHIPITDYEQFLNILKEEQSKKLVSTYEIQYDNDCIYIFKNDNRTYVKLIVKYKPETTDLLNLTKDICRLSGYKTSTYIVSSSENNFNIIAPIDILRVLYAYKSVLSRGEIPFLKFKHKSKNGKIRDIIAPHEEVKKSLKPLNKLLQNVYDSRNNIQIAYKKGKSVKTGALMHKDHKYVFNIDLKDFYPSCKRELVKKYTNFLFRNTYNREFIEEMFLDTILLDNGLFIGSPISGTLANAVLSKTIIYLDMICKKHNVTLSVYADDISFSSDRFISEDFIMGMFNEAFVKYGLDSYFKINSKKSLGYSGSRRKVTGVSINDKDTVTIPRLYYRKLRVLLNKLANGDNQIDLQKLRGKIAYALMIDDTGKVLNYLKKYKSTVQQFSLYSGNL